MWLKYVAEGEYKRDMNLHQKTVLHVSPHPDDESIGAPAILMQLKREGYRVVNLACTLGRRGQHDRRKAELREACRRAGFELRIADPLIAMSSGDDMLLARRQCEDAIKRACVELQPDIIVSPGPQDVHHAHELVGSSVRYSLERLRKPPVWWIYDTWGSLPYPTLYFPFGKHTMDEVLHVLGAHVGENDRNDYKKMVLSRAGLAAVIGTEKVFGFGAKLVSDDPYAELLTEAKLSQGRWVEGSHRILDARRPLENKGSDFLLEDWLLRPGFSRLAHGGVASVLIHEKPSSK